MPLAHSKLTAQGQISVPAKVRRKLGVGPGSVIEWHEDGEQIVVRRIGRFTSADVHRTIFPKGSPKAKRLDQLREGIRKYVKSRHARR
jgi:AbrB family looped-hinge helix DNA binding protein